MIPYMRMHPIILARALAPWLALDYTRDKVRLADLAILTEEQHHPRPEFNNAELSEEQEEQRVKSKD